MWHCLTAAFQSKMQGCLVSPQGPLERSEMGHMLSEGVCIGSSSAGRKGHPPAPLTAGLAASQGQDGCVVLFFGNP